ncbi:hypothetical protein ABW19_dt0204771 [Dactylella cylindrospora]|nr:hypothetical protein ABW19_dt0204771 [Dactylella cylindrospora]
MRYAILVTLGALAASTTAQQTAYGQCGGQGWTGATTCVSGYTCTYSNDWYSQCVPGTAATTTTSTTSSRTTTTSRTTTSRTSTSRTTTTRTSTTRTSSTTSRSTTLTTSTRSSTTTATPVVPTTTTTPAGPTSQVPSGSFTVEGYAKDNPTGVVSGGAGGSTTTVSAYAAFTSAVKANTAKVVYINGIITLTSKVKIGSNTSVIGLGSNSGFTGKGLSLSSVDNIIIRNLKISFVKGDDLITLSETTRVWIDHNELFSDISNGPDYYDGQIDVTHASDYITISWNYFHDHWKSSLVGNSDSNRAEDFGHLHLTYHHNYWKNMGTRGPAGRFGHQHIYNNLYEDFHYQAIHSRSDNQVLVEGNVFRGDTREALSSYGLVIPEDSPNTCTCGDEELDGYANLGATNDWGTASINITRVGTFTSAGYAYNLTPLSSVESVVKAGAGVGKI